MLTRVLLVLGSAVLRKRIRELLTKFDVLTSEAQVRGDFWGRLAHENSDLILVSRQLIPSPVTVTINELRELPDRSDVIVFSDQEDPGQRAELLAAGCLAVLHEGLPDEALRNTLGALIKRRVEWQTSQMGRLGPELQARLSDFVSSSASMQAFMELARRVVSTDSSLLFQGETGVGKERLARAIHNESPRAGGPFVAVNCGALPETLLESELFGHEEGAFTGAIRGRRGHFELAHRGTVFLDEIGEMPLHLQVKLLRTLQERQIQRVGSERPVRVDVRVMAATNRDLAAEVEQQRFRRDLYYRLAVVTLTIPPLRERQEDIPDLVASYVDHFNVRLGMHLKGVSQEAMQALLHYGWPGNVRELINVMERAILLSTGDTIALTDLPHNIVATVHPGGPADDRPPSGGDWLSFPGTLIEQPWSVARQDMLEAFEREYFSRLLERTGGRVGETARQAGIQPRSLFAKMRHHGLKKEQFKRTPSS